jgi:hypothetical protein
MADANTIPPRMDVAEDMVYFENNAPIMGTSGKSIAARPKRILIGIIQIIVLKRRKNRNGIVGVLLP